jgi:mannose-6-phosphate isomerase
MSKTEEGAQARNAFEFPDLTRMPVPLVPNRIYRGYPGGREMCRFRGEPEQADDLRPEAWVGSTTLTMGHERHPGGRLGLAQVRLENGDCPYLKDLIDADPAGLLGQAHVARFGPEPGVLVKLLDAERQLGLQCHPDRAFAKTHFNSPYGKVECWYVLGIREDAPEPPYLLLGFKEGVTRETFEQLYQADDITAMEQCCHRIPAVPGEMFHVGAGVPHAIGTGCFVIEVQEPSDITVGARRRVTGDATADKAFDARTMGSYHYDGRTYEQNLAAWRVPPVALRQLPGGREDRLIGNTQTTYFGATRLRVTGQLPHRETGAFSIAIVTAGQGRLVWPGGTLPVRRGDEFFLPAGLKDARWEADDAGVLEVVCCHPPEIVD